MRAATQHAQGLAAETGLPLVAFAPAAKAVESIMPSPSFPALPLHALEMPEGLRLTASSRHAMQNVRVCSLALRP